MSQQTTPSGWALFIPESCSGFGRGDRYIVEIGPKATEADVWKVGLGWPPDCEIRDLKALGARAFPCRLVEVERHD